MPRFLSLLIVLVLPALSGCATVFTGTSDPVTILSEPLGAQVYVDQELKGVTPLTVPLRRNRDHEILIRKSGYEEEVMTVERDFNGVSLLNLAGMLFWVVDISTGAMWKFQQDAVTINLQKGFMQEAQALGPPRSRLARITRGLNNSESFVIPR